MKYRVLYASPRIRALLRAQSSNSAAETLPQKGETENTLSEAKEKLKEILEILDDIEKNVAEYDGFKPVSTDEDPQEEKDIDLDLSD